MRETIGYKKLLSGNWGIVGPGLVSGQVVTVFKSNGGVETETVGRILTTFKTGKNAGCTLATIAGRIAYGPRGNGSMSHVFTAPRTEEQSFE